VLYRGEAVSALERAIYSGRISPTRAKRVDEMQAVADALSLLAHIVLAWKPSQTQAALGRWSNRQLIPVQLIGAIAPSRLESINLRGVFRFPVDRYADQICPRGRDHRSPALTDETDHGLTPQIPDLKVNRNLKKSTIYQHHPRASTGFA